jgi:hypothetical protein
MREQRIVKFRAWIPALKQMGSVTSMKGSNDGYTFYSITVECLPPYGNQQFYEVTNFELMQFTGLVDSKGVEIYDQEASDLIRKAKRNRKRHGFNPGEYLLIPFQS